jgi:hypothetical protein
MGKRTTYLWFISRNNPTDFSKINDLFNCQFIKHFFLKAYESVGCYISFDSCWSDVFVETLSSTQCTNADASITGLSCPGAACGNYYLVSYAIMTVELGLLVCTSNGFKYVGFRG